MDILEKIENVLNEAIDMTKPYAVTETGGSIGTKKSNTIKGLKVVATFDTKDAAKEYAKKRRESLTKGEKGYYKLKYAVVSVPKSNKK